MENKSAIRGRRREGGGVAAVDRALAILSSFEAGDISLSLAEIAERTGIYKSTILRIAQSLVRGRLLLRLSDGHFRIGSEALRLGTMYQLADNTVDVLMPAMRELARSTGESVAYFIQEGMVRVCTLRVESDQPIRYHARQGEALPLELGSAGRIILAFTGERGEPYDSVRRDLYYVSLGERRPDTSGIAAPVFGPGHTLLGALAVSGPRWRINEESAEQIVIQLLGSAMAATRDLGGNDHVFVPILEELRGL